MKRRGVLFILSAPSGCGKTTLSKMLVQSNIGLINSISMTTRRSREDERDGVDYFFVEEKEFKKAIVKKEFLEWTKNFGFYYGTPKRFIMDNLKKGQDILLSIDVKGAIKVKKLYKDAILIFLLPPSLEALKKRLKERMTDSLIEIKKRLKIAEKEISYLPKYDYSIINDNLKRAKSELESIITAERLKYGAGADRRCYK